MGRKTDAMMWRVVGGASGLAAAALTRQALGRVWRARKHDDPPATPASTTTSWPDAVLWAVATGIALGVARLVALRGAAAGWQKAKGSLPPGLEKAA
ncbi:MAG: DUF4235 domain-containing protein [Mycobacteriales bacterium]